MTPISAFPGPVRLLGLITPVMVAVAVVVLLLLPNLIMHMGLHSNASPAALLDSDAASRSAAAAVESPPVVR